MKQVTFDDIDTLGKIENENDTYRHFHYPEMLIRYDSNFIEFKELPFLKQFKKAENYLRQFHLKNGQRHVKFYFPANEKPAGELVDYMTHSGYDLGYMELYAIQPNQFTPVKSDPDIDIQFVTDKNFETFLHLQYQQDLEFSHEFANQKIDLHKRNFKQMVDHIPK